MENENIIALANQDGSVDHFEFLDRITYEKQEYVVLLPIQEEDDGTLVIMRAEPSEENDDYENYCSIEDEETLMAVFEIFNEKLKEQIALEDDE